MALMVIMITLTTTMAMDITDIPIIITVMREANTIGVVMNGVNIMEAESIVSIMKGEDNIADG